MTNSKASAQRRRQADRILALVAYGGDPVHCACCGETTEEFLCIDHIAGGGNQHKKAIKKWGSQFYAWLRSQGYPPGFRVLCHNCNLSLGYYGYCPHTRPEGCQPIRILTSERK